MIANLSLRTSMIGALIILSVAYAAAPLVGAEPAANQSIRELLEKSEKERKGLMFYVKGQTIGGAVTKIGTDYVEVKNQTYSRIIIRVDSIDAVAIN
jgi:hypothetical protein